MVRTAARSKSNSDAVNWKTSGTANFAELNRHPRHLTNMVIITRPDWHIPERLVTPEAAFLNRRHFLRHLGLTGAGVLAAPLLGFAKDQPPAASATNSATAAILSSTGFPARRNPEFNPNWTLTRENIACR